METMMSTSLDSDPDVEHVMNTIEKHNAWVLNINERTASTIAGVRRELEGAQDAQARRALLEKLVACRKAWESQESDFHLNKVKMEARMSELIPMLSDAATWPEMTRIGNEIRANSVAHNEALVLFKQEESRLEAEYTQSPTGHDYPPEKVAALRVRLERAVAVQQCMVRALGNTKGVAGPIPLNASTTSDSNPSPDRMRELSDAAEQLSEQEPAMDLDEAHLRRRAIAVFSRRGCNQTELAKATGVSDAVISYFIRKMRPLPVGHHAKVLDWIIAKENDSTAPDDAIKPAIPKDHRAKARDSSAFQCPKCPRVFGSKQGLSSHLTLTHSKPKKAEPEQDAAVPESDSSDDIEKVITAIHEHKERKDGTIKYRIAWADNVDMTWKSLDDICTMSKTGEVILWNTVLLSYWEKHPGLMEAEGFSLEGCSTEQPYPVRQGTTRIIVSVDNVCDQTPQNKPILYCVQWSTGKPTWIPKDDLTYMDMNDERQWRPELLEFWEKNPDIRDLEKRPPTKRQCPECPQTFTMNRNLKRHMASEHRGRRHVCKICGKKYTRDETLKEHMRSAHPMPLLPAKEGDPSSDSEATHLRTRIRPFKHLQATLVKETGMDKGIIDKFIAGGPLPHGYYRYSMNGWLGAREETARSDEPKRKRATEEEEEPPKKKKRSMPDDDISVTESLPEAVKTDMNKHTCWRCYETFGTAEELRAHQDTMHFKCTHPECRSVFLVKKTLSEHLRNCHAQCTECNQFFDNKPLLAEHWKTVHPGMDSLLCEYCERQYGSSRNFEDHLLDCKKQHTGKE